MDSPVIRFQGAKKIYPMSGETVEALKGVDINIYSGELVAIMGPSGSGKSTLMHIAGLLDSLTEGKYWFDGEDVSFISRDQQADIRNKKIGFIFQSFNLLARCTAQENVELPMLYQRPAPSNLHQKSMEALRMVGMENRSSHLPSQLSGGQQQRVAIARALINDPTLIMADEPTGNLDTKTGKEIMNTLAALHKNGITVIIVTHDHEVGQATQRRIFLRDGLIEKDEKQAQVSGLIVS
ncbi:MAG: ABC transporter ATP-binding protein [Deltaproteobacteria bacterium]|nr:ABC transporter ATP-binding protein [Deltaproteobacteria bacterium]